jgi:Holliday junction resolvase RusA-like endonuclease
MNSDKVQVVELAHFYSVNMRPISANSLYKCWRGRICKSKQARNFKENFLELLKNPKLVEGKIEINCAFYFKKYPQDLDNCLKVLLDACNKILWKDDSLITKISCEKIYPAEQDKIEICIIELF